MSQKPSLPKGMRDFGPLQMARRNYILDTIKKVFQKFGFMPLETPAMENLSTLTGKYGDEGDQLLFKVLNSGDFLSKSSVTDFESGSKSMLSKVSEKGLKYDLTVPFARYVVMNQNDITFPFKRYQIQPVWRADRPQRGRYREFYQCDADVVGTDSLICEAEIVLMITEVFEQLKFTDYSIKINHRAILTGMAEAIGAEDKASDLFVAIDKLDKIGLEKVCEELLQRGLDQSSVDALKPLLSIEGSFEQKIEQLTQHLNNSESGKKGIEELQQINAHLDSFGFTDKNIELDTTLARGLSYYTGAIFEVKVNNVSIGSVSGGGRYDNLTGVFGLSGTSGVGFSFGIDRIYDCLEELNLFEEVMLNFTEVLITHFDEQTQRYGLSILKALRDAGIKSEIYPDQAKLKKQFGYADKKGIPYTITIGSEEMNSGLLSLKNMADGQQEKLSIQQIITKITGQ
ncbi:histidine--tRNA ligase [Fulvivirga lutimaris]|uniref:histidine--tRNA ligase n=1 Tax=Fulvivirga lutimaris TaxID=1819566 RepID=UPI0012BCE53C|nr:histidine--tRNA ligase [Fulvivirga lutimaris]MTI40928.1 histidine--tRNA ligase [Fulvivirga lutimaris]